VLTTNIFAEYGPPFDLRSDMLFAAALAPAGPLRATFPGVPFLSLAGRTPLVMWFSRIKEGRYRDPPSGEVRGLGGPQDSLYNELNVLALLRWRAAFVPGIYATSALTIAVGHGYGMPKQPTQMTLALAGRRFRSQVDDHGRRTYVRARLLTDGRRLGARVSRFWPWWSWPACFPDGRFVRAQIRATPRVQLAHVQAGRLALAAPWLPRPVPLLPFGVYLPDQCMRLPPPPG
jgi:hypothetical protein